MIDCSVCMEPEYKQVQANSSAGTAVVVIFFTTPHGISVFLPGYEQTDPHYCFTAIGCGW